MCCASQTWYCGAATLPPHLWSRESTYYEHLGLNESSVVCLPQLSFNFIFAQITITGPLKWGRWEYERPTLFLYFLGHFGASIDICVIADKVQCLTAQDKSLAQNPDNFSDNCVLTSSGHPEISGYRKSIGHLQHSHWHTLFNHHTVESSIWNHLVWNTQPKIAIWNRSRCVPESCLPL
jgi:hypothetical protein